MIDPKRTEIQARLDAATPGEWTAIHHDKESSILSREYGPIAETQGCSSPRNERKKNAEMLAHAPADIAYLLAELDRKDAALLAQIDALPPAPTTEVP